MAKKLRSAELWRHRISKAIKFKKSWETKFKCATLERYYEGEHWKGKKDFNLLNYAPYYLNLVYSTIKQKLALIQFQKPSFIISPTPGTANWDLESAILSAQIKQDVVNTIVQNPNMKFARQIKLAAQDSFFRFGIIEVGYAADWQNPAKDHLYTKSWDDADVTESQDKLVEDYPVPSNERFFVKRIPAEKFLVSISESTDLNEHEWCGYYTYEYARNLRATKGIDFPKDWSSSLISSDYSGYLIDNDRVTNDASIGAGSFSEGDVCKVWHIWDYVSHSKLLILDGYSDHVLWEDNFERIPFIDLRWDLRSKGFYPIPVCFNWLSPQDEINEAREQTRSFRRRFTRKFQAVEGTIDDTEIDKFVSGPDGIVIKVKKQDALSPVGNPEIGPTAENALILAKDDFNIVSGTSSEARGQADRTTATQAKLIDLRSNIRESSEQMDFGEFVCLVAREILVQAKENLASGLWVKYTTNPGEKLLGEVKVNQPIFKWIQAQDIDDGYDFTINIDVVNSTPAAQQQEQQAFVSFLSLVHNFPEIAYSPILIREAAYRVNYRNEQVIHQMQQTALLNMKAQAAAAAMKSGVPPAQAIGDNVANAQNAQMESPMPDQTQRQIEGQLG